VTTKPSGFAPGYAYTLNTKTKAFTRLFGGINGLTTLGSPDLSQVLYGESGSGTLNLGVFVSKDSSLHDLSVRTLPEKCVWANTEKGIVYCAVPENVAFNTYPDVWYQGLITFSDDIWKINTNTGEKEILMIPDRQPGGEIIDMTNMSIDPNDDYLIFNNKIDLSLWGYQLKVPIVKAVIDPLSQTSTSTSSSTR
jgi:hypothetical protein